MLPLFQDNFILGESTSTHFFRVTTSTQQSLFRESYFFRTAAFFSFFRTVTFSQELFFQNSFFFGVKLLQSRHFLRIRSSLRQIYSEQLLYPEELFRIKISKDRIKVSKAGTSAQYQLFQKSYFFRKGIFRSIYLLFSGKLPF